MFIDKKSKYFFITHKLRNLFFQIYIKYFDFDQNLLKVTVIVTLIVMLTVTVFDILLF